MIQVILVEDHPVVRNGYRRLIDAENDLQVVGEAATAEEANALIQRVSAAVALVDLSLKGSSGIEAIRGLRARRPQLKILVLSMHESASHVIQALRSGANGYLTKCCEPMEVIEGIRGVFSGRRVFSPEIAEILANEAITENNPFEVLTPREFEVLRLMAGGRNVQQIAEQMNLSQKTILNYQSLIRQKLDIDSDFKLLQLAASQGLLRLDIDPGV